MERVYFFVMVLLSISVIGCSENKLKGIKDNSTANTDVIQNQKQESQTELVSVEQLGNNKNSISTAIDKIFSIPYFPEQKNELFNIPVNTLGKDWKVACLYSKQLMNSEQSAFFDSLPKMQDDGDWETSLSKDFDRDGNIETVSYGAYKKNNGEIGNFVLITRIGIENKNTVILLREFPEENGRFACFYLVRRNQTIMFGSNLIGGELTWNLEWTVDGPVVSGLGPDN